MLHADRSTLEDDEIRSQVEAVRRIEKKMLCSSNQPEYQSYRAKELANISDESDVDEPSEDTHGDYAPEIAVATMVDRKIHVRQLKSRNICTEVTDIGVGKQGITPVKEQNEGVSLDHKQGPSTEPTHGPGPEPAQEKTNKRSAVQCGRIMSNRINLF